MADGKQSEVQPFLESGERKTEVVEKGDSYIAATEKKGNKLEVQFTKEVDDVKVAPAAASVEYIGLTKEELEQYAKDPFWRTLR